MIELNCEFRRVNPSSVITSLKCYKNDQLILWWFGGFLKNKKDNSQPLVKVAFRKMVTEKTCSNTVHYRYISISALTFLRIGSICYKNRVIKQAIFQKRTFDLKFNENFFRTTSFRNPATGTPFPLSIHSLDYRNNDRNQLLEFDLPNKNKLIIPCLEYFLRCYGQSSELKRILVTYPWDFSGGAKERLFAPLEEPHNYNETIWKIKLRKNFFEGDTVFLAHLKYDLYTKIVSKKIYSNINVDFKNKIMPFPIFQPWFRGNAKLEVEGIHCKEKNIFLGLKIINFSEPSGVIIDRTREKWENSSSNPISSENNLSWKKSKINNSQNEILDLTDADAPDINCSDIELESEKVGIIGKRRPVRIRYARKFRNSSGGFPKNDDQTNTISAGDPNGTGKGIGHALIYSPISVDSNGAVMDMWNAIQHLKNTYPEIILNVESYNSAHGFNSNVKPNFITLNKFSNDEIANDKNITTSHKNWVYFDPRTKASTRHLLITRINICGNYVYLIEIERRNKKIKNEDNEKEESLQGIIFMLKEHNDFDIWLNTFRSKVRKVMGKLRKIKGDILYEEAYTFNHTNPIKEKDIVPCWTTLARILNKFDVIKNLCIFK